jgi:acyl carrier protein
MTNKDTVAHTIFSVIDEVNEQQPDDAQLEKSFDTTLFGPDGTLDSMGLVNLIVTVEQRIDDVFDVPISVSDERAMSQRNSPFRTVGTLVDYVSMLLEDCRNA